MKLIRLAAIAVGGTALMLVLANAFYFAPRATLLDQIDSTQSSIASLEGKLEDQIPVRKRQKEIARTLLAKDQDLAEHRFRTALSTIAERAGLIEIQVSCGQPSPVVNPVTKAKVSQSSLKRSLASNPDFSVVKGQLKGKGSLEQVLQAVASVQSQPWIHRFEGFSLKPLKGRENFEIRLDVSTMLAQSLKTENGEDPVIAPASSESEALWRAMLAKNVFKAPAADSPAQPPVQVAAAPAIPAVGVPYEEYKLTGVVRSSQGVVAFLLNTRSGERVTLLAGGKVLDAVLIDGQGERAVFDIAGKRYEIFNGNTLAARRQLPDPVNSPEPPPVAKGGA
jgi:hypothetical protein